MNCQFFKAVCLPLGLLALGAYAAARAAESQPAAAPAAPGGPPAANSKPAPGQAAPSAEELATLVRQLGDPSHQQRARASDRLTELGLAARDTLVDGLKSADPEVRRRCRWVLADVLEADHRRRLEEFVADSNPADDHGLVGWTRFRRVIGRDGPARELFVQMHRAEAGLLASAAIGPGPATESLQVRFHQVYRLMVNPDPTRRTSPTLSTVAALMFVSTSPDLELPQSLADSPYLQNMIHQPEFQKALREGPYKPAVRKLLGQWILRPGNVNMLAGKLQLAMQHDLDEGLYLAIQALSQKEKPPGYVGSYAVSAIGVLGGKLHAARLVPLLEDQTECTRFVVNNVQSSIEVRDIALAWLIHLAGQKHDEYGLDQAKQEFERMAQADQRYVNFGSFRFKEPDKRGEAIKRWKAWLEHHPLRKPPDVPEPDRGGSGKPAEQPVAAAGAVPPLGVAPPRAGSGQQRPPALDLAAADRFQVRALAAASQLGAQGRYAEAARLLGDILASATDYSFQPDPDVLLYRCLKPEAERVIAGLPQEAREAYRTLFEDKARHLLGEAVRAGDAQRLGEVAGCYFHTRAGAEATYLLALYYLDHGEPFRAALYLDRLRRRSTEAQRYEPALSVVLAACWAKAGMPEAAEPVLLALRAQRPGSTPEVAGRPHELFTEPQRALAWLESLIGPSPKPAAAGGWPMFRGGPSRNVAAEVDCPFLRAEPAASVSSHPLVRETAKKLCDEKRQQFRTALPQFHPLVVGQAAVVRTATELRAIEPAGDRLLWEAPLEDRLRCFLKHADNQQKEAQAEDFARGLGRRLWQDTCFGTLSSDGRLVFGVEDLDFGFRADHQQTVVGPDGRRRLDPAWQKNYNLLVAYDLTTGKAQWEIGGPPDIETGVQAGTYFLGPPLPLGGRLYVVADVEKETRLLELDARSGRPTWQITLATQSQPDPQMRGFMLMQFGLPDQLSRRSTASPSYADGILVCRTSDNHFVGVDLTTRSVQWLYQSPEPEIEMGPFFGNPWMRRLQQIAEAQRDDDWADASVTIAEGRILLTPPDSGKLLCLNLADGRLDWSVPRRDGLFLACVHEGRVVVVGRGSLWAVKLADGTPAWPGGTLQLPADALASGRGMLSGGRYYLPLSTAEVAAVDLVQGRIAFRSRSPEGIVPGNLVACRGTVLSQDTDGLRCFPTLADRHQQTAQALARNPNDPAALADHGEILLCQGQLVEAIDHLRRAMAIRSDTRTRRLLIDALEDGLRADFATFRELAVQLDPVIDSPDVRCRFLRQLALAHQQAGQVRTAFETYLKLADVESDGSQLEHTTATRVVRRDRWTAARLAELYGAASPQVRTELDRLVLARLRDDRLPEFLTYFSFHAAAQDARLRLAAQLGQRRESARAEWLLHEVVQTGDKLQHRAAVARLAALLRQCGRPEDAARVYRQLAGPMAEEVCADGKTGRQLVEALPADDPVRRAMAADPSWPEGEVRVEVINRNTGIPQRYPLSITGSGGPLDRPVRVEIDSGGQSLIASEAMGRKLWESALPQKEQRWGFSSVLFSYSHGRLLGHTLVAWLGNRVCAIDTLGPEAKALWVKETFSSEPPVPGMAMFVPWRMQMFRQPGPGSGSNTQSLAVTSHCVCFQQEQKLLALDPQTGQLLWSRSDVDSNSDLFGNDEMIFLTPPDSEEAAVYSAVDGRELGWRQVPEPTKRLAILGCRLLTWETTPQGRRMALVDPWPGRVVWQRAFSETAQPWVIDNEEVAVLDRQGRLAIVRLPGGEPVLDAQLDPEPALDEAVVVRSEGRYVVVASRPDQQAVAIMRQSAPGNVAVNGRVWGVDRATGKPLWSAEIDQQAMRPDQPRGLPVLVFFNTLQKQEGNQMKICERTLCLDTRNGRTLHRKDADGSGGNVYEVQADPDNRQIEIRTVRETVKLTFTSNPVK